MSNPSAAAGRTGKRRSAARAAVIWGVTGLVSYGLTLTLISDTFFWFAIPGVLGLLTVVIIATHAVLNRSPGNDDLRVLMKRYAAIVLVSAVLVAVPLVVDVRYAYPLMGVGMMAFLVAGKTLVEQRRRPQA
ncbi:hypothetical protein [Actinomadura sp. 6K520]|jgi:hypothetical protein|uniref:hypothetical protein n=1 Tax=Actinomadura sp. 6K520 TaxID=2530364 RepID=UPI001052F9B5|nr:hypothetical protein [Actinomadura sp. 6K520]TDE35502.1 hypothetical protein E1289_07905 [Actinomadura sp. 6K520]